MFEFCIPVIQDYGALLKGTDWMQFRSSFEKLFLMFICCTSKGAKDYQRSMYSFRLLLHYWESKNLPVMEMLRGNHTIFSEESGEIALSMLVSGQPDPIISDLEQTRNYWQAIRFKHAIVSQDELPRNKHRLLISK